MSPLAFGVLLIAPVAADPPLADYFGFDGLEIVRIDDGAGPLYVADMNGDGLNDMVVVNNHGSRIEIHRQKPDASPEDAVFEPTRPNELPEHWRFERIELSVSHRVMAVAPHDFDGDGRMDLVYAGTPPEIVFCRQVDDGEFKVTRKHHVRDLSANRNAFAVSDLIGDARPELAALVDDEIHLWTLDGDNLGEPVRMIVGGETAAFVIEDYNGDDRLDLAAVMPDDTAPLRLWLGGVAGGQGVFGPQVRFPMPALTEFDAVRVAGRPAACMAAIERASKRMVISELTEEPVASRGNREAAISVFSFSDPGNRNRAGAIIDTDADGALDLVAADTKANALVVYRQVPGRGIQPGVAYPCYAEVSYLAAGNVDDDPYAELFVLSEQEGVVGRCDVSDDGVPYPVPLAIPEGHTPVALALVELSEGPRLAVVVKDRRDYLIVLIDPEGGSEKIELGTLSRSPETILALDADQNGRTDLLLFTRDKPMTMLYAGETGYVLTESDAMGQFGLVQAARADNTVTFDIDGNGQQELLIADRNFVRAVRYMPEPAPGVSPGWQVVKQVNADDRDSKLVSLAVENGRVVAADEPNDRLIVFAKAETEDGPLAWRQTEALQVRGFDFSSIKAGAFSGDGRPDIMAIGDDGFAVIRLAGQRLALEPIAVWRAAQERRYHHEVASGDLNGDGFTDLVSLDAGEQMCDIFTFSSAPKLLHVTGFQVFESKIFSSGEPREWEPSEAVIADVTGDGAQDLLLLAHDRILLYPQMTETTARK